MAAMFYHFFGSCFGGHDEASLLAFEALRGSPRPARGQALDAKRTVEVPLCGHVSCQFLNLISAAMMKQFLVARNLQCKLLLWIFLEIVTFNRTDKAFEVFGVFEGFPFTMQFTIWTTEKKSATQAPKTVPFHQASIEKASSDGSTRRGAWQDLNKDFLAFCLPTRRRSGHCIRLFCVGGHCIRLFCVGGYLLAAWLHSSWMRNLILPRF